MRGQARQAKLALAAAAQASTSSGADADDDDGHAAAVAWPAPEDAAALAPPPPPAGLGTAALCDSLRDATAEMSAQLASVLGAGSQLLASGAGTHAALPTHT